MVNPWKPRFWAAQAEIERLRKALEFYADPEVYKPQVRAMDDIWDHWQERALDAESEAGRLLADNERLRAIGRAILDADQRGQGTLFAEAMDALFAALTTGQIAGNRGET